ncbi:hypothetical protein [Arcobacter sp.]|uniref:hypothetical protein n=1 Tax=unclassified Arcobacter TaxID=2593671 RepID=UPI003B00B817
MFSLSLIKSHQPYQSPLALMIIALSRSFIFLVIPIAEAVTFVIASVLFRKVRQKK